jgi:8-oxo-dGTP diphosphatase
MVEATLCIPTKGNPIKEILLGYKKVGFGQGKYTGIGGKIEAGESPLETALRELEEESGLFTTSEDLHEMGHLTFIFPNKPEWDHSVHLFLVKRWEGEPFESDEIKPIWFDVDELPFDQMWDDGRYWLPMILSGMRIRGHFIFGVDNDTVDNAEVEEWEQ